MTTLLPMEVVMYARKAFTRFTYFEGKTLYLRDFSTLYVGLDTGSTMLRVKSGSRRSFAFSKYKNIGFYITHSAHWRANDRLRLKEGGKVTL